jgi:hypothetical protein
MLGIKQLRNLKVGTVILMVHADDDDDKIALRIDSKPYVTIDSSKIVVDKYTVYPSQPKNWSFKSRIAIGTIDPDNRLLYYRAVKKFKDEDEMVAELL